MRSILSPVKLVGLVRYLNILLGYTLLINTLLSYYQHQNIAELFPVSIQFQMLTAFLHCWAVPNFRKLLGYILSYYFAELLPILRPCWWVSRLVTLLSYTLSYYIAELYRLLKHWQTTSSLRTLLFLSSATLSTAHQNRVWRQPIQTEIFLLSFFFEKVIECSTPKHR